MTAGYERRIGRYSRALAPELIAVAALRPLQRALDVGCGAGALTEPLARVDVPHRRRISAGTEICPPVVTLTILMIMKQTMMPTLALSTRSPLPRRPTVRGGSGA
jgi:hypothetical protein